MKKHYFLGLAGGRKVSAIRQLFAFGRKKDLALLERTLSARYGGKTVLCKNGRSGLALALRACLKKGDGVIVNGFTCYAVVEAIKASGCVPVYADISREDLNYTSDTLERLLRTGPVLASSSTSRSSVGDPQARPPIRGIIIQNTLGNPVDIAMVERFAKENDLMIIEDLAHCAGVRYKDKREAGTVGVATVLSFGKDKSIDTTSGGAVIFRGVEAPSHAPTKRPKLSDSLRARWYPSFAGWCRGLARVHLCGALMRLFVRIHFVEKSADNKLDTSRRCTEWQAKLALEQVQDLRKNGEGVIRDFYLVNEREKCLKELKRAGYHFDGFWYERPVSPERYYKKVHFPEEECPVATEVAKQIINFPKYYRKSELDKAQKIIRPYLIREGK